MSEPSLLQQIAELGQEGEQLLDVIERIAAQAKRERRQQRRSAQRAQLERRVAAYLADHPGASANEIRVELRARRQDVLRAVAAVRARFPDRGNHAHHGGPDGS